MNIKSLGSDRIRVKHISIVCQCLIRWHKKVRVLSEDDSHIVLSDWVLACLRSLFVESLIETPHKRSLKKAFSGSLVVLPHLPALGSNGNIYPLGIALFTVDEVLRLHSRFFSAAKGPLRAVLGCLLYTSDAADE